MTRILVSLAFLTLLPAGAQAACYAEYKAKQDNPLSLHYGIMLLDNGSCPSRSQAENMTRIRLQGAGWTLLKVLGVSEKTPSGKQRSDAGANYLRY